MYSTDNRYLKSQHIVLLLLPCFIMACTLYTSQYRSNQITACKHYLVRHEITACKHYLVRHEISIDLYSPIKFCANNLVQVYYYTVKMNGLYLVT